MIDKDFCMSSYLALRYIERPDVHFSDKLTYKRYVLCPDADRILVKSAKDIDESIEHQITSLREESGGRLGLLLSGGMDSSILASYLPGCDAYTFRFLGGDYQKDELQRAETFAKYYGLNLHYIDIDWSVVTENLKPIMSAKGGPVHSIEPQICHAAKIAKSDGIDTMIIGDGSDYVFGGMDQLLSRDWSFEDFYRRYVYVEPSEVLKNPQSVRYLFERYRLGEGIDFVGFLDRVATEESYGSYANAFEVAGLRYFDPYERLKMAEPLDLKRIRNGESKYLIRELFKIKYPDLPVPNKLPMPRPVDAYFASWQGPTRPEFREDIEISQYKGNQKWLIWCLEQYLNLVDEL